MKELLDDISWEDDEKETSDTKFAVVVEKVNQAIGQVNEPGLVAKPSTTEIPQKKRGRPALSSSPEIKSASKEGGGNFLNLNLSDELYAQLNQEAIDFSVSRGKIITVRAYVLDKLTRKP